MPKTIIVTVTDAAEVEVKTTGFTGSECKTDAAVVAVKNALGETTKEAATAEMHATKSATQRRTF